MQFFFFRNGSKSAEIPLFLNGLGKSTTKKKKEMSSKWNFLKFKLGLKKVIANQKLPTEETPPPVSVDWGALVSIRTLHSGYDSEVNLVWEPSTHKIMVVKKARYDGTHAKYAKLEAKILRQIHGLPQMLQLKQWKWEKKLQEEYVYFLFPYVEGGDLFEYIHHHPFGLSEMESLHIFRQILSGIQTLHQQGIFHRDIKPENILLSHNHLNKKEFPRVYLSDFNLAIFAEDTNHELCGSFPYIPPELFLLTPFTAGSDVSCLGLTL